MIIKSSIQFITTFILLFLSIHTYGQTVTDIKQNSAKEFYISLTGQVISGKNQIKTDWNIASPVLHLFRTQAKTNRGTILLLAGNAAELLKAGVKCEIIPQFLMDEGFDVANLEYNGKPAEAIAPNLSITNSLQAYRILRANAKELGIGSDHFGILGLGSGGYLAARTVQKLEEIEQPDELVLIDPLHLDETLPGTVFPAVMPPLSPKGRLLCTYSSDGNMEWIRSAREYTKTWIGYDGQATFKLIADSANVFKGGKSLIETNPKLSELLKTILETKGELKSTVINQAAIPVAGYSPDRHAEKLALVAKEKFDLILIGNSITNNFEKDEYQPVWKQFFEPRKSINLGYSGYRTENLLWNIEHGELDGQSPKVIIVEIGTNNIDEKNYPTRHTAGQLAGGIEAIVKLLREKCPESKVVVMRCFPGCYGGPNPTSHRAILERASELVFRIADGKYVFYCDVNHVFLNMDGSINHEMMPDWLHPSPEGAKRWAQAMEPLLSELMGDKSLDTEIQANSAIVPASKLEEDSYNWWGRHAEILQIKDSINPEIVLIGNSITHFWGGEPRIRQADGRPRIPNGPKTWAALFGKYRVLNLGFGWDRTQNALWRLDHGELDGLHPGKVIIDIGTNNTSGTSNARMNSATEIVEGIREVCLRVRSKVPGAKIILMAVFPREQMPENPRRILINEINRQLEKFANAEKITFVDLGSKLVSPYGTISKEIMGDFCHPTEMGYQIWADAIKSLIAEP